MENIVVYLTARHGVGQRLALSKIDERLRRLPLRQSLLLLYEICFEVEQASTPPVRVDRQIEVAERVLSRGFLRAAVPLLRQMRPRVVVMSPQVIVLLGIRLLAVSSVEVPEGDADGVRRELGALCVALGDHVETGPLTDESTILDLLRLSVFYGQSGREGWLTLAGRLFFDVLPRLSDDPAWMDPLERFRVGAGLTLERFWAITVIQALVAARATVRYLLPLNIQEGPIPATDLEAWRRLLTSALPTAVAAARTDIEKPVGWSMGAVWKRPIIDLGGGRGPVLRASLLQMQAEPAQMFWHLRDVLHEQGVPHPTWSTLYGRAVEALGLDLLREHVDPSTVLDDATLADIWAIPAGSKRADAAIVTDDGDLVVIDFVSRQFTRETTASGDFDSLAKDLRLGVAEKLKQVDVTLERALAAGAGTRRIFPVVVIAGPFPMMPSLDPIINEVLLGLDMQVIGSADNCRPWMVLDLLSFLMLLHGCSAAGVTVPDLLEDWQESPLARNEFREWTLTYGPASGVPGGGLPHDWMERVNRDLGPGAR